MNGGREGGLRRGRARGGRRGRRCRAALGGSAGGSLGDAVAALAEPVRPLRTWWVGGGVRDVGIDVDGVAVRTKVLGGLAGPARAVTLRLDEPVEAGLTGDGLELLADEKPVGEVGWD